MANNDTQAPAIATIPRATDSGQAARAQNAGVPGRAARRLVRPLTDAEIEQIAAEEEMERKRLVAVALGEIVKQLGKRYSPALANLQAYRIYHANQTPVIEALRTANVADMVKDGRGIVLLGSVGTGKDHLLAAMRWLSGPEFYGDLRDRMDTGDSEDQRFHELKRPKVLAISDPIPPVGGPTAWNVSQLYRLLDRRYRDLRSTWMTLNATSERDADELLSAPIWDRLRENALVLKCFWPSYRQQRAS